MMDPDRSGKGGQGPQQQAAQRPSAPVTPDAASTRAGPSSGADAGAPQPGTAQSLLPALTLPAGGGAIRGIGEKFQVNAATGTASLGVPLPISPGRGGFGPAIELSYDSGAGNGPFGLGFALSVPAITRKTDQGLPRYYDDAESDDYILSGAEDLVPERDAITGALLDVDRGEYVARRYRPRVEGLFARIERWIHRATRDVHWRVTTADNTTHVYGRTAASRIADPKNPTRVFSFLLEESRDDKGNVVRYEYKAEDGAGVEPALPSERTRFENGAFVATAQRYLKRALYCNAVPFVADDFLMEVVFDYGEHAAQPLPDDAGAWPVRVDPSSSYRATFEVRTYRLCQRVLVFHRFSADRAPELVRSARFSYEPGAAFTYLVAVTHAGHLFENGAWQTRELPTLRLDYTRFALDEELRLLPRESLEGLQGGVDGARKQWVDLDGEGIPGVLIDAESAWYYKQNRGGGRLDPPRVLASIPSSASLAGGAQQLEDLGGDGQLDLVAYESPLSGYFSRTPEGGFEPLRTFASMPNVDFGDPNLRFIDLDGDGHGDLLFTEDHAFIWYRSKAKGGFEPAARVALPFDEDLGPAIVFADPEQSVHLADMSGDGLVDIVRVRNGEVCYWPNLGHGRFGAKITLENGPRFAPPEEFDARRVRFGDVDGSGTSDLFYLGRDAVMLHRNESGNRLAPAQPIRALPPVDSSTQLAVVDLLGQGTACLVWSSPLPSATTPVMYVDLTGGVKPHLLRSVVNNLGAETRIEYAPSTRFYLDDKAAGRPWLTRLAFPVHVVSRLERLDAISKSRLVSTYTYHHGYFDGVEREFRGFGRVEQRDAESFSLGDPNTELDQPPTRVVTWYHTGAWLEKERLELAFQREYFQEGPALLLLRDTVLPTGLSIRDEREAARALRGRMLRQEIYAEDGTARASAPYLVTEQNFSVRRLQASAGISDEISGTSSDVLGGARHGVFFAHAREAVSIHTERNPADPRVTHEFVLEVDDFGNVTRQVSLAYARAAGPDRILPEQAQARATLKEADFINRADEADWYRVGVQYQTHVWELTGLANLNVLEGGAGLLDFEFLRPRVTTFAPENDLPYDAVPNPTSTVLQRRLLDRQQQLFYDNALDGPLALGVLESLALPYETYQLALTTGLVQELVADSQALTGNPLDPAILLSEARYVQRDDNYWAPSGRVVFDPARFYLPIRAIDPFGAESVLTYDDFALLPIATRDPLGNLVQALNDYRVLAPSQLTDPNLNRVAVRFDPLGLVERTAVMGKAGVSPGATEGDTLDDPTTRLEYDLLRWQRGEALPAFVHTFARERHGPTNPRFQETFTYSDGFGRVVQQKVQAEPGEVPGQSGTITSRWVGTGRTVFNNKGNPVKQYEPFFSATSDYEDESAIVEFGVTPIIHYDPLDRVSRTELPDGSESRVEFDPWRQRTFDPNDAIEGTRWLTEHQAGTADQQRAAALALAHANTPTIIHLDTLGRPFLVQADNGPDPAAPSGPHRLYETRSTLDIEGNVLAITDALGNVTIQQRFDVLARRYRVQSPDAGIRVALADITNSPLRSWDARGQTMRPRYDLLRRQTHLFIAQGSATERLLVRSVYGEALELTDAQAHNLRGRLHQLYDCAGLVTSVRFDFKGNLRESTRRLAIAFQSEPDWYPARDLSAPDDILDEVDDLLEDEPFTTTTTYDALNRVVTQTTPDGSISRPTYNEANLLEQLRVAVRGGPERLVINDIDYNARGQRIFCEYVDPTSAAVTVTTSTTYEYDPKTFRLNRLLTTRGATKLQDLLYIYDPVGNIVALRNNADNAPFFNGSVVSGDGLYVYDPLYRLIEATGREHPGTEPVAFDAPPGLAIPHPNDTQALSRYTETYRYDPVGNIDQIAHGGVNGWTRNYEYVPGTNRLEFTSAPGSPLQLTERYTYDAHGSMTSMPHLPVMEWDYADRLKHTNPSVGDVQDTYFTYDAGGQRVRKVFVTAGTIKERIYLGGYELYRERANTPGSAVQLERQTLHVMDDTRRVALVETKTRDGGSDVVPAVSQWRFQLDNHLGSATIELDHDASVISYEEYHPYGSTAFQAAKAAVEVSAKRYRYTGKERDEETGLYYHGARYYAPWLGRWTAADPAGFVDGTNLFQYARSNPICNTDPGGTKSNDVVNPRIVKQGKYTGKETQEEIRAQYAELGIEYEGNAAWNSGAKSWFVDRSQLKDRVEELTFEEERITGSAPPGPAAAGGSAEASPDASRPATAGEAAGAFAKGALKGAAMAAGLVALGSVGTVIGVGLLAYGAYKLATGGYKDVAAGAKRLFSGQGTAADFEAAGGVVGGVLGGGAAAGLARGGAAARGGVAGGEGGGSGAVGAAAGARGGAAGTRAAAGAEASATGATAGETGGSVFFHGTTSSGARSIMAEGVQPVSVHTHAFPQGSFFTFAGGETSHVAASHWAARSAGAAGEAGVVLRGTLPANVVRALMERGLMVTKPVPGLPRFPPETVFLPEALPVVNQAMIWRVVPPVY